MPAGELNKRVILQYVTEVSDGMGSTDDTWNDGDTIWAALWPLSSTQTIGSMQPIGTISHRIRIRWRSNFRSTWRLKFGERIFDIVGPPINPNEKNEFLDIMAKEIA